MCFDSCFMGFTVVARANRISIQPEHNSRTRIENCRFYFHDKALIRSSSVFLIPILLEQQFFDAIGMEHLVIEQMAEHDEYRVVIERLVDGRFLPLVRR